MQPDEVLAFKLFDSDRSRVQLTGHTAFDDPTSAPDAPARESIEIRTISFIPERVSIPRTSLEQWAVLAAVIDHGGFAQAATALNKSQSAISYAIARLQESLDVPVLVIEGRKAVLTPHGQALLKRARSLLKDADTLERLARSLKQGWEPQLRLVVDAAFPRDRLLKIIAELQQLCPNTQMQLRTRCCPARKRRSPRAPPMSS